MSTPRITGECAGCGKTFDLTKGLGCPHCPSKSIAWAFYDEAEDIPVFEVPSAIPHILNDDATAHREDCDACDIDELNRLYSLPDTRV